MLAPLEQGPSKGSAALWLALATGLSYAGALANGFVLDDYGLILQNRHITAFDIGALFSRDYWSGLDGRASGLYRPLTLLSFALEYRLAGAEPLLFHLDNLLLHLGVCLLLYWVMRLLGSADIAFVAALLFAVHPIHTEAVAGVAGRADLLASAGVLASLGLSIGSRRNGDRRLWFLGALCLGLGLLSKELAVVGPILLLAVDWFLYRRGRLQAWPWGEYLLLAAVVVLYLLVRQWVLGGQGIPAVPFLDNPLAHLPLLERWVNGVGVAYRYLFLLVFPLHLSADYSFDAIPLAESIFSLEGAGCLLALVAVALLLYRFYYRPKLWVLGLMWMGLAFLPVANVLLPIGTIMAERLAYLPSAGFVVASADLYGRFAGAGSRALPWWAGRWIVLVGLVLLGIGRSAWRCADWRDNYQLFASATQVYPNSAKAQQGLGAALLEEGRFAAAAQALKRATAIYPDYAEAHYHLGLVYGNMGQGQAALTAYRAALRLAPRDIDTRLNLGATYHGLGQLEEAIGAYQAVLQRDPLHGMAQLNLAHAYFDLGRRPEASQAYRRLLRLYPNHPNRAFVESRLQELR